MADLLYRRSYWARWYTAQLMGLRELLSTFWWSCFASTGECPHWKNAIGLDSNNVMAVTVIESSFRAKLDLWLRGPSLPAVCIRSLWVIFVEVLLYLHHQCNWPLWCNTSIKKQYAIRLLAERGKALKSGTQCWYRNKSLTHTNTFAILLIAMVEDQLIFFSIVSVSVQSCVEALVLSVLSNV